MKAVQFAEHGRRDVLEYDEFDDPEIDRDEVLVDVKAAALNHLDVFTRMGLGALERLDLEMPHIPGSDAAGVVEAVGEDVARLEPGDRVAVAAGLACGHCEFCRDGEPTMCVDYQIIGEHVRGVHSEQAALHEDNLIPLPEDVDFVTAA